MKIKAVIEIPMGSSFKYEKDKYSESLILDRPLNQPIPYNYGYIPDTLCDDRDALDIFILTDTPIYPLAVVNAEILGVIKCLDNGLQDDKIVAVLVGDCPGYEKMGTAIIEKFLETYKTGFTVLGYGDKAEAEQIYWKSVQTYVALRT